MRKGWNCLNSATRFPHHHQRLCKFKAITPNMDVYQKLWTVTKTDNSYNNLKHVLINKENIGSRNLLKTSLLSLFLGRGYFVLRNFFFIFQMLSPNFSMNFLCPFEPGKWPIPVPGFKLGARKGQQRCTAWAPLVALGDISIEIKRWNDELVSHNGSS